jgi:hypothetical protein
MTRDATTQAWSVAGTPLTLVSPVGGWAARTGSSIVYATGSAIETATAGASAWTTAPLQAGVIPTPATTLLAGGCTAGTAPTATGALSLASVGPLAGPPLAEVLAVSFQMNGLWWIATVDLGTGSVARALTGPTASAVALVPSSTYPITAPASWSVIGSSLAVMTRYDAAASGTAGGCPVTAAPTSALQLGGDPLASIAAMGGLLASAGGSRVMAVDAAGELQSILPPSMTSQGPVFRLAAYAGLSAVPATVSGVGALPVAVAEHAYTTGAGRLVDTASATTVISFAATGPLVSLGGSAYAHGAAWLDTGAATALAFSADVPGGPPGGAAQVVRFGLDQCSPSRVRAAVTMPVAGAPGLIAQGPARAGALGPDGVLLFGPNPAPVYGSTASGLSAFAGDSSTLACLLGAAGAAPDWSACASTGLLDAGIAPIDAVLSAGDGAAAIRHLDGSACGPCASPFSCVAGACAPGDLLCQRVTCPIAPEVVLARPGLAPRPVALPGAPRGLTTDPGGGFLVTVPCDTPTAGSTTCFATSTLCAKALVTRAGMGVLLLVAGDGSSVRCLAVARNIAGPVAVTPNGDQAWLVGAGSDGQLHLTQLGLARNTDDGTLKPGGGFPILGRQTLGAAAAIPAGFPPSGIAFAPDGTAALVTVPGEFRVMLIE